jgi:hypothetical protein
MKRLYLFTLLLSVYTHVAVCQTNIICTNAAAEQVLLGTYNPAIYQASNIINDPAVISKDIMNRVSPDSMLAYLRILRTFENRNAGSDTTSPTRGIGAARSWIYSKFQQFSASNENRLLLSYLQFDLQICNILRHKNVMAVLPGMDINDKSIIIIEAHMDSRCAGLCDTSCLAEGMEDNGSGMALVMELARIMSKYSYNHTIVFTTVTAEEQGLMGADAMADYVTQKGIAVKAVLNNDVIGGIICGQTSSAPSCPGLNDIDSTHVRLFSFGGFNSPHKQLSRFIKLEYKEMIQPMAAVPMGIHIMTDEDRTGRGGDHIPFRQKNYTAMRFTSANEHGDASNSAGYSDRQHTSDDILGVDTDNDQIIDSFFVDFNYLARNTVINGNAASMIGIGPTTPDFTLTSNNPNELVINITDQQQYLHYRIGVRTTTNDWDSVYTFTGSLTHTITVTPGVYIVSVASVDSKGVESLFSKELMVTTGVNEMMQPGKNVELLQNKPNPFDEATMISVAVGKDMSGKKAYISIRDIAGKEVKRMDIPLKTGINEVVYEHGYNVAGTFIYTLVIDGQPIQSKRMVFAN